MRVGDVYEIHFPFKEDLAQGKRRPVVVIGASAMGPDEDQVVLVVPVMDPDNPRGGDIDVIEWRKAGLTKPCVIRARRLVAVDPRSLKVRRGVIPPDVLTEVLSEIKDLFKS